MDIFFKQQLVTEDGGMCDGRTWYSMEDIYQKFKERLLVDIREQDNEIEETHAFI